MAREIITKVPTAQGLVDKPVTLLDVVDAKEPWTEYTLEDGAIIRIKQSIVQVLKHHDLDPLGNNIYTIQTQPVISIIPARKK